MIKTRNLLLTGLFSLLIALQASAQIKPVDYVDPIMGTTDSRWMLFPGASMPFGMVKLSPDNQRKGWKAGYEYKINNVSGFSHIHSWTMGGLLTMPTVGELKIKPGKENDPDGGYRSRIDHDKETAKAGYYSVLLQDYDIKAELTSTTRAGFQRFTFPESEEARVLIDLKIPTEYSYEVFAYEITKETDKEIEGNVIQQSLRKAN
jgi:putative alpha-1,2-mannosidase